MAEELHTLLHGAGIAPPYVLVGHSMGGLIARVFIQHYPGEVSGLALIDSSHPQQQKRLPKTGMRDYPGGMLLTAALEWMRPLGLRRLARDLGLHKAEHVDWSRNRRADLGELLAFDAVCREAGKVSDLIGLPLVVLTSAAIDPNYPTGSRRERARSRFYPGWVVLQDELAALSANSTRVAAQRGGHHRNRDNPDLVSDVIASLIRQMRS
jgi:pimeloyl-ACP methyl ester carboxylesterase